MVKQAFGFAAGALGLVMSAGAQNQYTVDRILSDTVTIAELKCRDRGQLEHDFRTQGKPVEARQASIAEWTVCDCMPNQVGELRASLSAQDLKQQMTEAEFQKRYLPRIMSKCAAEALRATYGEGCSEQFAAALDNSAAYCECMEQSISQLSEAEALQLGFESSDYNPRAAEAAKRGDPPPARPPLLATMFSWDATCRTK